MPCGFLTISIEMMGFQSGRGTDGRAQVVGAFEFVFAGAGVAGATSGRGDGFGRAQVGSLLVEMAFDHGRGMWEMFADLGGGEFGPGGQAAGVDGITPGGDGW